MSAHTPQELAKVVQLAMTLHEKSWSNKKGKYLKDRDDSFEEACKELKVDTLFAEPFYLASDWHNDLLDWATNVLQREGS